MLKKYFFIFMLKFYNLNNFHVKSVLNISVKDLAGISQLFKPVNHKMTSKNRMNSISIFEKMDYSTIGI